MELVATKVVVLILLGLIKLVSGLIPLILDKVLQVKKVRYFVVTKSNSSFCVVGRLCEPVAVFDIYQVAFGMNFL